MKPWKPQAIEPARLRRSCSETLDASGDRAATPQAVEVKQHASGGAKRRQVETVKAKKTQRKIDPGKIKKKDREK